MTFAEKATQYGFEACVPFTLRQCVRSLSKDGKHTSRRATLVAEGLADHPNLCQEREDYYVPRHHLFAKARFRMCPLLPEIEQGILYPGHRFSPFCHPQTAVDEFTVVDDRQDPITYRAVESELDEVAVYHTLMPMSHVPFLVPEEGTRPPQVWLNALDLTDWYSRHDFQEGDTIIGTVLDLSNGIYQIKYASLQDMQDQFAQVRRSDIAIEEAIVELITTPDPNTLIETQLFYAYARADRSILQSPSRHLGAILSESERITWTNDGSYCYLHGVDIDPHQEILRQAATEDRFPKGKGNTVAAILDDLGIAVSEEELKAMIRDAVSEARGGGKEAESRARHAVFDAVFPHGVDHFVDARQATAFLVDFDKLWTKIARQEKQQPTLLPLARLRRLALEVKGEVREFLRELDAAEIEVTDLPASDMINLSQIDTMLNDLLVAMETDPEAAQSASSLIEHMSEMQESVRDLTDSVRAKLGLI